MKDPTSTSDAALLAKLKLLGSEHGDYQHAVQWFKEHDKEARPYLLRALASTSHHPLRIRRIIETLGELREEMAVPWLANALQQGKLLWECAQALGKIGTPEAEAALTQGLRDDRLPIAKECTKALGHIHSKSASAALMRQLRHMDISVRTYACRALLHLQPQGLGEVLLAHVDTEHDPSLRLLIQDYLRGASPPPDERSP